MTKIIFSTQTSAKFDLDALNFNKLNTAEVSSTNVASEFNYERLDIEVEAPKLDEMGSGRQGAMLDVKYKTIELTNDFEEEEIKPPEQLGGKYRISNWCVKKFDSIKGINAITGDDFYDVGGK